MWGILWARGISQLMWSGDVFIFIFFCRSLNTQKTQNAERHSFKHSLTHASVNTSTVFQESALICLRVKEEPSCSMEEKERMIGGKGGQCPNKTPQMPPPPPFFWLHSAKLPTSHLILCLVSGCAFHLFFQNKQHFLILNRGEQNGRQSELMVVFVPSLFLERYSIFQTDVTAANVCVVWCSRLLATNTTLGWPSHRYGGGLRKNCS